MAGMGKQTRGNGCAKGSQSMQSGDTMHYRSGGAVKNPVRQAKPAAAPTCSPMGMHDSGMDIMKSGGAVRKGR